MSKAKIGIIIFTWVSYLLFALYSRPLMYYCMFKVLGNGFGLTGDALYDYVQDAITYYFSWYTAPLALAGLITISCIWGFFNVRKAR